MVGFFDNATPIPKLEIAPREVCDNRYISKCMYVLTYLPIGIKLDHQHVILQNHHSILNPQ